ncbi:MAG: C40 family peptidase [Duodenibacillus sp.]
MVSLVGFPQRFDCSGFVSHVWRMAGFIVPRDADQMMRVGYSVPIDDLSSIAAGSHLFFGKVKEDGTFHVSHVGLSLGGGRFIHALGEVKIASLIPTEADYDAYNASRLIAARRINPRIREGACFAVLSDNGLYRVPVQAPKVCNH